MSNVVISYSPNDFFYVKFDEQNNSSTIDNKVCDRLKPYDSWDTSCNTDNYDSIGTNGTDNKNDCNLKELCKNKEKAEELQLIQNNHSGSGQNYLDTKDSYNTAFLRLFNLGVGIFIIIGLIYKNRNI
jgi:hypothetical protein